MNTKLIKDEVFLDKTKKEIEQFFSDTIRSAAEKWELFKQRVKLNAIERGGHIKYQAQKQEQGLRQELEDLVRIETAHPGFVTQELQDVRRKLESLEEDKYRGAIIRARAQKYLAGKHQQSELCLMKRRTLEEMKYWK